MTNPAKAKTPLPTSEDLLEKYSCAVTLSDMEIFIYPELLYSLVLANIMSPRIWAWRDDPWFRKINKMSPYRRVMRLKQYIIDHYEFNLDLDTWGLTTQEKEIGRFEDWVDRDTLAQSNALFGYEGDKYYFDLDIRRHFGLDKYSGSTIPYWKTETVEAMDAFRHKEGYSEGAGECVSLATLYAAALFIVARIPLEDIFLTATPLHSQNFILVKEGVLTNNRRIVTKKMWFNGTELTARAQRALRNEQVTVVAHNTGYIHGLYPEATIDREHYGRFSAALESYLTTEVNAEILANFLREHSYLQQCFQFCQDYHGHFRFIAAEKVYAYEHGSPFKASDKTKDKLLETIDEYEFYAEPISGRVCLENFESFFWEYKVDFNDPASVDRLLESMSCPLSRAEEIIEKLKAFCHLKPRLPGAGKTFSPSRPIACNPDMEREELIAYLESMRREHPVAELAFYAYRDLARTEWAPFMKAALERNPASVEGLKSFDDQAMLKQIASLPNESIYDGPGRLAQPDEVWNFQRGDGLEKAICSANVWQQRHPDDRITLKSSRGTVTLQLGDQTLELDTAKGMDVGLEL